MNNRVREALALLQEECAEVIVEISKCNRFGIGNRTNNQEPDNRSKLETEIGDVFALLDILFEENVISKKNILSAVAVKKEKLKQWTNLYKN